MQPTCFRWKFFLNELAAKVLMQEKNIQLTPQAGVDFKNTCGWNVLRLAKRCFWSKIRACDTRLSSFLHIYCWPQRETLHAWGFQRAKNIDATSKRNAYKNQKARYQAWFPLVSRKLRIAGQPFVNVLNHHNFIIWNSTMKNK